MDGIEKLNIRLIEGTIKGLSSINLRGREEGVVCIIVITNGS